MDSTKKSLKQLEEDKVAELREIQGLRNNTLAALLQEKEKLLCETQDKLEKLKADFKYNLHLLQERDEELTDFDRKTDELKQTCHGLHVDISNLQVQLSNQESCTKREVTSKEELKLFYQQKLHEKELHTARLLREKESERESAVLELEESVRVLERKLAEVIEEGESVRIRTESDFDEEHSKRERAYRVETNQLHNQLLAEQLKVKTLERELEASHLKAKSCRDETRESEQSLTELQKETKRRVWQLEDLRAMGEARVAELEGQLRDKERILGEMKEASNKKYAALDKRCKEKDLQMSNEKLLRCNLEEEFCKKMDLVQSSKAEDEAMVRQLEWQLMDTTQEKTLEKEAHEAAMGSLYKRLEQLLKVVNEKEEGEMTEVKALHDANKNLLQQLSDRKADIIRYKKDLSDTLAAMERLEQSKAQLELDAQSKVMLAEQASYQKSESLIQGLTKAKETAVAEKTRLVRAVEEKDRLIEVMRADRTKAYGALKEHGISLEHFQSIDDTVTREMEALRQQNENLKSVIKQMRENMEGIGDHRKAPEQGGLIAESVTERGGPITESGTKIAADVTRATSAAPPKKDKPSEEAVAGAVAFACEDSLMIRTHIESLNTTIADLKKEKLGMTTQLKRLQVRLNHMEGHSDTLAKQPQAKQVEIDRLQYEVTAQKRRSDLELSSLRSRISELDIQLAESRREGDEYYCSNIEQARENTILRNQVSALKVALSDKSPSVNFGGQELVIQQLQDETELLRSRLREAAPGSAAQPMAVSSLKKKVDQLTKERQVLLDLSNKLRAELKKHGKKSESGADRGGPAAGGDRVRPLVDPPGYGEVDPLYGEGLGEGRLGRRIQAKLAELEEMQEKFKNTVLEDKLSKQYEKENLPEPDQYRRSQSPIMAMEDQWQGNRPPGNSSRPSDRNNRQALEDTAFEPAHKSPGGRRKHPLRRSWGAHERSGFSANTTGDTQVTLSSIPGRSSVEEVWKLLDGGNISAPWPEHEHPVRDYAPHKGDLAVSGTKLAATGRAQLINKSKKLPQKVNPRVRNYNVRDK